MAEDMIPRAQMWTLVVCSAIALTGGAFALGLTLAPQVSTTFVFLASVAGLCCLISAEPDSWRDRTIRSVEHLILYSSLMFMGAVGSYALASVTGPWVDGNLVAADELMGFDWIALYRWTAGSELAVLFGRVSYATIFISPFILLTTLTLAGQARRAQLFIISHWAALALTLAIFIFFPAKSALIHHLGPDAAYLPFTGVHHVATIEALQRGEMTVIGAGPLYGLITFPSFHATSAVMFIWAAWPIRSLRAVILTFNVLMLAATPIEGTHYLIDVVGGVAVAAVAICATIRARQLAAVFAALWRKGRKTIYTVPVGSADSL